MSKENPAIRLSVFRGLEAIERLLCPADCKFDYLKVLRSQRKKGGMLTGWQERDLTVFQHPKVSIPALLSRNGWPSIAGIASLQRSRLEAAISSNHGPMRTPGVLSGTAARST
jgi:hypothetical protein